MNNVVEVSPRIERVIQSLKDGLMGVDAKSDEKIELSVASAGEGYCILSLRCHGRVRPSFQIDLTESGGDVSLVDGFELYSESWSDTGSCHFVERLIELLTSELVYRVRWCGAFRKIDLVRRGVRFRRYSAWGYWVGRSQSWEEPPVLSLGPNANLPPVPDDESSAPPSQAPRR